MELLQKIKDSSNGPEQAKRKVEELWNYSENTGEGRSATKPVNYQEDQELHADVAEGENGKGFEEVGDFKIVSARKGPRGQVPGSGPGT